MRIITKDNEIFEHRPPGGLGGAAVLYLTEDLSLRAYLYPNDSLTARVSLAGDPSGLYLVGQGPLHEGVQAAVRVSAIKRPAYQDPLVGTKISRFHSPKDISFGEIPPYHKELIIEVLTLFLSRSLGGYGELHTKIQETLNNLCTSSP